ncbi:TonB-dependent receptor [Methylobacterium gnaphalii]|uniref:TonB-dependent receptor n=1 Tax=Methylobacterium gnaphalii TaxID=1010610 RepID=A0A512JPH9_9HYPH|nr:TonB-dependent receptor [Methylobacterium gnaphalii]GJD71627.1 Vitamin B12 transporter BtuB [Methylobacterium gnaphalii]GLS47178.1 TonB-dependent receptor [Methylobacterium gnaphalii]
MPIHRHRSRVKRAACETTLGSLAVLGTMHGAVAQRDAAIRERLDEIAVQGQAAATVSAPAEAYGIGEGVQRVSLTHSSPVGLNLDTPSRSGSRLGLTPLETPASVDIVSGETARIRGQNATLDAVSQNATGITSYGSPGFGIGSFTSRGFAGPNSVQTLYDGTRMYVGAGTVTFPYDTWNVERIEVLRGPASVLYGDGAIGGIVNVVSKQPLFTQQTVMRVGGGSQGTARIALDSTGPIGESVAYRLTISGNRSDGWVQPNGDFQNVAISGALLFQATPNLSFTLSHDFGYQEPSNYWGTPLVDGRILPRTRFNNYNVRDARIAWADNWTQLKTEWTPSADVTVRNTSYRLQSRRHWQETEQYRFNPASGLVDRSDFLEIFHQQEQFGNRLDATFRGELFGLANQFSAGFDVNHISFRHTNNFNADAASGDVVPGYSIPLFGYDPGTFPPNSRAVPAYQTTTNQASVFAENRLQLTDQLSFLTGVRFDAPTLHRQNLQTGGVFDKSFQALGDRFALLYNPTKDTTLYAQYATATDPVGSLITLSQSLAGFRLSTGEQVEIGAKGYAFDRSLEWTLAGYRITKNNLISAVPGNPTVATQVGQQSSQGVEAAMSLNLPAGWRIDANIALLHAQYDQFIQGGVSYAGNQPIFVPERVANVWVTYAFARDWEARIGLQNVGQVYSDFGNTARLPAYTLVNLGLDYQVTKSSRASFRVYNLFDRTYAIDGNAVDGVGTNWLLGRPRSFEVAYTVAW